MNRFRELKKDEWCHVVLYAHYENKNQSGYGNYNIPNWLITLIRIFGKEKSFYEK
jgi:hypothetical protein